MAAYGLAWRSNLASGEGNGIGPDGGRPARLPCRRHVFAFTWRASGRHRLWLCLLAVLVLPLTMVPLELQPRIIDRAIGDQNLDLLIWLGALYRHARPVRRPRQSVAPLSRVRERTRHAAPAPGRARPGRPRRAGRDRVDHRLGGGAHQRYVGESFSKLVLRGALAAVSGYMRECRSIRGAAVAGSQAAASVPLSRAAARRAALFSS